MPVINNKKATTLDTATIGPGEVEVPSNAHLKPSTTPTIGFNAYKVRHCSGTSLAGYTIGVR